MSEFTQGKWEADAKTIRVSCKVFRTIRVGDIDEGHNIAIIPSLHGRTEQELLANTRLIAAAPKMYEALCELVGLDGCTSCSCQSLADALKEAQELVARIDGKQQ